MYVLIRSKRNLSSNERLEKILNSNLCDKLHKIDANIRKRIHLLNGSLELENIGLNNNNNENDFNDFIENCEIVIHSAANVNFDDPMEHYIQTNIIGTENLLKLCNKMSKLQLFVYLSTAFCQINHAPKIDEKFYVPIMHSNELIRKFHIIQQNDDDYSKLFNLNLPKFMGKEHINYTLSKNSAEALVKTYENDFPIVVLRPSIGEYK